jgi:uncharacterized membrane protein
MTLLTTILLILHITSGSIGLITGTINLLRRKGDALHRKTGTLFTWAMILAGISAITLSILRPNYFLTIVGIFTLYMVGTGKRYIQQRRSEVDNDPAALDWILTIGMAITGVVFIALGLLQLIGKEMFGIVYVVFGAIGILFVRTDLKNYRGKAMDRNYWLLAHLQRMTGSYIAALTAFLVVNADKLPAFIPGMVYWLLPSAILTPLIIQWSTKYRVR